MIHMKYMKKNMIKKIVRPSSFFSLVLFIFLAVFTSNNNVYGQCTVSITPSDTSICVRDTIILNANDTISSRTQSFLINLL